MRGLRRAAAESEADCAKDAAKNEADGQALNQETIFKIVFFNIFIFYIQNSRDKHSKILFFFKRVFVIKFFSYTRNNTNLEELGGMNIMVVGADGAVRTPRLTGTILEGSTRGAIITLLADAGREVVEEQRDRKSVV